MTSVEQQTYLAQNLRSLQTPQDSLWWPPAPGWWAVSGFLAILVCLIVFKYFRKHTLANKKLDRKTTAHKMNECFDQWQSDGDTVNYISRINYLLRQTAIRFSGRHIVARLSGYEWIQWMEHATDTRFSAKTRNLLEVGGYQSNPPSPDTQSHIEITNWLNRYTALARTESTSMPDSKEQTSDSFTTRAERHA